jgi:hypothetical protein
MKPLGSDYSNGVNFAIAGATATPGDTPFSLDVQVDQYIFYRERCNDSITRGFLALHLTKVPDCFEAPSADKLVDCFLANVIQVSLRRSTPKISTKLSSLWTLGRTISLASCTYPMIKCLQSFPTLLLKSGKPSRYMWFRYRFSFINSEMLTTL